MKGMAWKRGQMNGMQEGGNLVCDTPAALITWITIIWWGRNTRRAQSRAYTVPKIGSLLQQNRTLGFEPSKSGAHEIAGKGDRPACTIFHLTFECEAPTNRCARRKLSSPLLGMPG